MRLWSAGAIVAGVAGALLVSGCSSHPGIYLAEASGDGTILHFEMGACNGDYDAVVDETADQVTVSITDRRQRSPFSGDDCADSVGPVQLAQPLGDRLLINGSDRSEIPVWYIPWNQARYTEAEYLAAVEAAGRCVQESSPDAVVTIASHSDGYPDLSVEWPDLGDGERSSRDPFPDCNNEYVEPLRR